MLLLPPFFFSLLEQQHASGRVRLARRIAFLRRLSVALRRFFVSG
jgi:hypothetical protein